MSPWAVWQWIQAAGGEAISRLEAQLEALENGGEPEAEAIAPHSDSIALQAARAAELILVPCRPAILDLEAIASTLDLVRTHWHPSPGRAQCRGAIWQ